MRFLSVGRRGVARQGGSRRADIAGRRGYTFYRTSPRASRLRAGSRAMSAGTQRRVLRRRGGGARAAGACG